MGQVRAYGNFSVQIFATDLDPDAIEKARQGVYLANIAQDISPERLNRFFVQEGNNYRIGKEIREMIVFASQNLVMDPPFTRLDLLVCRNLLIYLSPEIQKRLIPLFHYCLNPGGSLFLGSAETMGIFNHLFTPIDRKLRLYRRIDFAWSPNQIDFPPALIPALPVRLNEAVSQPETHKPIQNLQVLADQVLLKQFAPAAVLVNTRGDILYVSGWTGKYLELAAGKAGIPQPAHPENRLDRFYLWQHRGNYPLDRDYAVLPGRGFIRRRQTAGVCICHHSHPVCFR